MANYTYRISASGTAAGADAGFTTVAAAISDFKANNRMGAGTGVVAASSTLFFKIDGFLDISASGADIYGIDTSNSGAAVVLEAWANRWNAAERAIGYTTSFDGLDFGSGGGMNAGLFGTRQGALTIRNLVLTNATTGTAVITGWAPAGGTNNVQVASCFIRNSHATGARLIEGYGVDLINCTLYAPSATSVAILKGSGLTLANKIDQCTIIALGGAPYWYDNQGDPLPIVRNTYIGGTFTNGYAAQNGGTWSSSCVGNAVSTATTWTGPTGTLNSIALSTTNFNNVTNGSEDFRVKVSSSIANAVTRLSSPTTDVFGTARANPTTVGAYEAQTSNAAPTFSGTISNISATQSVAISSIDVHALFSDPGDTLTYSASPGGTAWPSGLSINSSTGVITGTMGTVATTTGCKVRATDTAAQTVDSNAFNVTVAAPTHTVQLTLTSDGVTPRTNLSGLKWAWFDQITPDLLVAPTDKGSSASTDGSGVLTITLSGTAKTAGGVGWLIVTDSDGTPTQSPSAKAFSGPCTIST